MKFIYFDVGGVLMKDFSDTKKLELMFESWGVSKKEIKDVKREFIKFEKKVCVGKSVEDFKGILEKSFKINLPKNYSINEDFVNRFENNIDIWQLVDLVKGKYKIGLLTNMYPGTLELIRVKKIILEINWDVIIDSSVEKSKKPEKKIYEIAQKRSGFSGRDILFIDNRQENLIVPKKLGWQTFWFDSSDYERSNKRLKELF
ncbi:MAG: HAD family hydrolase [Candidatus Shapirobacteria bacterium]|nr:HAD family hydrolase [Candidatus Shapirobacteria bacterium]